LRHTISLYTVVSCSVRRWISRTAAAPRVSAWHRTGGTTLGTPRRAQPDWQIAHSSPSGARSPCRSSKLTEHPRRRNGDHVNTPCPPSASSTAMWAKLLCAGIRPTFSSAGSTCSNTEPDRPPMTHDFSTRGAASASTASPCDASQRHVDLRRWCHSEPPRRGLTSISVTVSNFYNKLYE